MATRENRHPASALLVASPTAQTLLAMGLVFALQGLVAVTGRDVVFAVREPLDRQAWTIVVSVYAHDGLGHLFANALPVAVLGAILERDTSRLRFHAFFATTGAVAGVAVLLVPLTPADAGVLGASGAVFGCFGYLLTSNRLAAALRRVPGLGRRGRIALVLLGGVAITLATWVPGAANLAHFTGFVLGGLAGWGRLLATSD